MLIPGTQDEVQYDDATPLVSDSSRSAISDMAKRLNVSLSDDTKDYLYQHFFQEKQNQAAWARTMAADNTRYQRAVADLKAAGLNPFLAIQSLSPSTQTSSSGSIASGYFTQKQNSVRETQAQIGSNVAKGLMSMLAVIAAAVIYAL